MEIFGAALGLLGAIVLLIILGLVLRARHGRPAAEDIEYEQLRARYARGDIDRTEYEQRRGALSRKARDPE
ncbi:MAG: hypothetical protein ACREJG_13225 [Candidatus Rokuibacteriota bacterium]